MTKLNPEVQQVLDKFARELTYKTFRNWREFSGAEPMSERMKQLATLAYKRGELEGMRLQHEIEKKRYCKLQSCGWNYGGECKCPKT